MLEIKYSNFSIPLKQVYSDTRDHMVHRCTMIWTIVSSTHGMLYIQGDQFGRLKQSMFSPLNFL